VFDFVWRAVTQYIPTLFTALYGGQSDSTTHHTTFPNPTA